MAADNTDGGRPPVLVLGCGITALGVIRIFGRDGMPAFVAERADSLLSRSRWFHPVPSERAVTSDGRFEDWLRQLPFDRAVLLPCSDQWVSKVASLDVALRERFAASVPHAPTLERFVDKGHFAELLQETGTPHPYSRIVESQADLETIPDAVFDSAILKPRDSQGFIQRFGVKAVHVTSRAQAAEQLARLSDGRVPVILQEYIPGPATNHYFVDGFVDRLGNVRAIFVRQRLRMYPFDFGNSTFMKSVPIEAAPGAAASITSVLQRVEYRGIFSAEFKLDPRDGVFKILEVNARAWWYVEFAARCGVDVCRMAYEDALGLPVETVNTYAVGRRLVFPYHDFFACYALWRRGELTLWQWLRSWIGAVQPVFQLSDPAPGVQSFARLVGEFVKRHMPGVGRIAALASYLVSPDWNG